MHNTRLTVGACVRRELCTYDMQNTRSSAVQALTRE